MKRLKSCLPLFLLFSLAGCFEITEQIDIKKDGSGQLTVNTDMSKLLEMMQTYLGKDEMEKEMPKKVMDTTLLMKDVVDTAKDMTPEKKALVRNGKIHMSLNMDQKIFKADMHFPFTSQANLQKLYTSMNDGSLGTANLFRGLTSGMSDSNANANNANAPDMNQFNSIYDFQCKDGMISRKVNAAKWKELQQSQEFEQMKQATSMGIEMPYTMIINLPRPVKKVDNPLAKLSDDKKTVTIKYNLTDVFANPEKFEYTIAY